MAEDTALRREDVNTNPIRSLVPIARILGADGFTDHVANLITKYWKTKSGLSHRQFRNIRELNDAISKLTANMSKPEKLALGKFIGLHKKMSFDVGLKTGLMTFLNANEREGLDGK